MSMPSRLPREIIMPRWKTSRLSCSRDKTFDWMYDYLSKKQELFRTVEMMRLDDEDVKKEKLMLH